ncbi:MAG: M15 family metallopeptidase [Methylococcaceae bacterium]|nr:M15 family metallopeptidase [Methylococcaceae bacterium]MDD1643555.1 M15 family metallopeptidase [Methylococcaceae bacterium]
MRKLKTALLLLYAFNTGIVTAAALPSDFVYLDDVVPDIMLDIRYASTDNFIGKPIEGYVKPVAITTSKTASALKNAQADFKRFGLGLKVFDVYRPQRAVDHFVRWAKDWRDTLMKSRYYPQIAKQDLFQKEYIAAKSGHSRGSTVDVTLSYVEANGLAHELDMGTGFDFFDPRSWPEYPELTAAQRANRMLLQVVMEKHGFKPYPKEWWHFTLKQESYPDTYFNFNVD